MSSPGDGKTTVAALKQLMLEFSTERDWLQFHTPKNLAMAIAAEAGELLEPFLWVDSAGSAALIQDPAKARKVREELADVLIFLLEFANVAGIDLASAVREKLVANAQKYPVDKAKGTAKKYTEL